MRAIILFSLLLLTICAAPAPVGAQEQQTITCPACKEPNQATNNFCTSCGKKMRVESDGPKEKTPFFYRAPARLLSIPTAAVLEEMAIGLTLGNSFGQEERRSFLGNVALGIGNVAELELNTGGLVGNIISATTRMSTWGLKVLILSEKENQPALAVGLRSSNDWDNSSFDGATLQRTSPDYFREGLRYLDYELRMTTLSVIMSRSVSKQLIGHGSVGYADLRYRNLRTQVVDSEIRYEPTPQRSNQLHFTGGISYAVNPRTKVLAEIQTIPFFDFDVRNHQLFLNRMYVGAAGVRYALNRAITLDSGVRYQSNFVGLADMQVRVALNGVFVLPF
jgi:hypothetical protein